VKGWARILGIASLMLPASALLRDEAVTAQAAQRAVAVFAGGCFWSMEKAFDETKGVIEATSGYSGGTVKNPSYRQVVEGGTGHLESVRVEYDPSKVGYAVLLSVYWHHIDPTDPDGQFCDHGANYKSAIFYGSESEKKAAEESKAALETSGRFKSPIVTELRAAAPFYPAEAYHQDYAKTNPVAYTSYRIGCRRDARLKQLWGDEASE
jgi:peptide-methionine (S)-S-oxide reductase